MPVMPAVKYQTKTELKQQQRMYKRVMKEDPKQQQKMLRVKGRVMKNLCQTHTRMLQVKRRVIKNLIQQGETVELVLKPAVTVKLNDQSNSWRTFVLCI